MVFVRIQLNNSLDLQGVVLVLCSAKVPNKCTCMCYGVELTQFGTRPSRLTHEEHPCQVTKLRVAVALVCSKGTNTQFFCLLHTTHFLPGCRQKNLLDTTVSLMSEVESSTLVMCKWCMRCELLLSINVLMKAVQLLIYFESHWPVELVCTILSASICIVTSTLLNCLSLLVGSIGSDVSSPPSPPHSNTTWLADLFHQSP